MHALPKMSPHASGKIVNGHSDQSMAAWAGQNGPLLAGSALTRAAADR